LIEPSIDSDFIAYNVDSDKKCLYA